MPTRDEAWPDGTPCWADCQVDDPAAAADFYRSLFGWQVETAGDDTAGYLMASLEGRAVAGIGPKPGPADGVPSAWTTYFAASDADVIVSHIGSHAGKILVQASDVADAGRMAVAADPYGAVFGVWQARRHIGFGIFNQPGAVTWNELHTDSYDDAQAFYTAVFGMTFAEVVSDQMRYSVFTPAGADHAAGGCFEDTNLPGGSPSYWLTWFAVANCDDSAKKAGNLGGSTLMEPTDSPVGRMAVVHAPQGEVLGLIDIETTVGEPFQTA